MDITVDEGPGYVLVRACGLLGLRTVTELRDTLVKAGAEQPRGIVCDLRGTVSGTASLTVLHVVADQVAQWPNTPIVLVASHPALRAQLERLGLHRRLPVVADVVAAGAALRHAPGFLVTTTTLGPTPDAPAAARAFVTRVLGEWQVEAALDAARAVVSELVTNAVVHTRTEVTVRVSLAGSRVTVSVGDRGPGGIHLPAQPGTDGGWGLTVVGRLARPWGVLPRLGAGWVVWAVLADADAAAGPRRALPRQATRPA